MGRAVQAFDEQGNVVWQTDYDIYGNLRNLKGDRNFIPFRQLGQIEDEDIELYLNGFRYYDYHTGLYISQDPIRLAGNNPTLYGYVPDSNIWVDLFGLDCSHDIKAKQLGYTKVKGQSHGQSVYYNNKATRNLKYITPDVDAHNGGFWKAADSISHLGSKKTRSGTYSPDLIKIGD